MMNLLKTLALHLWCILDNWIDAHVVNQDHIEEITWVDELRWWMKDKLSPLFEFGYYGSEEELIDVWLGHIRPADMTERQWAEIAIIKDLPCYCALCSWKGTLPESGECPGCGNAVWMDMDAPIFNEIEP